MPENLNCEQTPYELKRLGKFDKALEGYALEFAAAADTNNKFVAEVCFDQMLDIVLLRYMQEKQRFPSRESLMGHAQQELEELLSSVRPASGAQTNVRATDSQDVSEQMVRCEPMLFPRGRGKVHFSVDPDWLISKVAEEISSRSHQ